MLENSLTSSLLLEEFTRGIHCYITGTVIVRKKNRQTLRNKHDNMKADIKEKWKC